MRPSFSALNAVMLALGATVVFMLLVRVGVRVTAALTPVAEQPSARARASRAILGSAIGQALTATVVATLLMRANLSLGNLGLTRGAGLPVWGASVALTLLVSMLLMAGPLRGSATLREWTAYRLSGGLLAGLAAGFGEEIVFRGFVISVLGWGGWGTSVQVALSVVLFGLAHAGWGGLGIQPSPRAAVGAALPTALIGSVYALLYLWGGRSLLPVIAAHALTDIIVEPALLEAVIARQAPGAS